MSRLEKKAGWDEFYKWWEEFRKARVEDLKKYFDEKVSEAIVEYGTPGLIGALLGAAYNFTLEPTQRNLLAYIALGAIAGVGAYALYKFITNKTKTLPALPPPGSAPTASGSAPSTPSSPAPATAAPTPPPAAAASPTPAPLPALTISEISKFRAALHSNSEFFKNNRDEILKYYP